MAVLMELSKIIIRENGTQQLIVLREVDGLRNFPIVINTEVATAIDRRLKGHVALRPMTHDLLADAISKLGATIQSIDIVDLQDHTYIARIVLMQDGKRIELDSRPSDAIAVGIGSQVPIYVDEHVLAAAAD